MTKKFQLTLLILSTLTTLGLFVLLCWTAAADAQGSIGFFIYGPVLLLLIGLNFYLGQRVSTETRFEIFLKRISQILAVFILLFYFPGFLGMTSFSQKVIGIVADAFEFVTGKSPMQWDKGL